MILAGRRGWGKYWSDFGGRGEKVIVVVWESEKDGGIIGSSVGVDDGGNWGVGG